MMLLRKIFRNLLGVSMRKRYPPDKYPFSEDLYKFMENHPESEAALKLSNPKRFVAIPLIFTSFLPQNHVKSEDEIIGIWYYDKAKVPCGFHKRVCNFKQDFIVNVGALGKEYIVYTADKRHPPHVQPISKFFKDYGSNGKLYHEVNKEWSHHYETAKDLPNEPRLIQLASTIEANNS